MSANLQRDRGNVAAVHPVDVARGCEAADVSDLVGDPADLGDAADIGAACVYLASRGAGYVTGQTIAVDGGWLAT